MNYRSYEWKIIYVFILVFVLIEVGSYVVLSVSNERIGRQKVQQDLQMGSNILDNLIQIRSRQLALTGQVLASDTGLREAIATGDRHAIESMLENHGFRIQAAVMLLTDMNRKVLAFVSSPLLPNQPEIFNVNPVILQESARQRMIAPMDFEGETLFQIITVPINTPDPVALLSIGFPMGDPLWQSVGGYASANYAFLARNASGTWWLHASTFPIAVNDGLLEQFNATGGVPLSFTAGNDEYLMNTVKLESGDDIQVVAVLGKSLAEVMAVFDQVQSNLLRWMLACVVLSMAAIFFLTRRLIGPLNTLAHLDTLTGVANRRLFDISIRNLCTTTSTVQPTPFALLMFDTNDFKLINDRYGHDAGDQVLKVIARRLKAGLRQVDLIARYGGDEFAVLLNGASRDSVRQVVETLVLSLHKPMQVDGNQLLVNLSIGIALSPDDGMDATELLRKADQAMYAAKHAKEAYVFFADSPAVPKKETLSLQDA
ncbi:MAG: diguanylate cyclase [Gammaproteobacteria bacterium]|nr:diguanylate cyclase [Gammaproteobacteria bacterium]MDP2142323.1 diguanylate cyclase [Gammaproteobacteria bacterium]MDP2348564.1 diguanylate cyclase [Gammaproteobacteria bacterium]